MLDNNSESERKFTIYSVYQNNEKWCCREPHGLVVVVARLPETVSMLTMSVTRENRSVALDNRLNPGLSVSHVCLAYLI